MKGLGLKKPTKQKTQREAGVLTQNWEGVLRENEKTLIGINTLQRRVGHAGQDVSHSPENGDR